MNVAKYILKYKRYFLYFLYLIILTIISNNCLGNPIVLTTNNSEFFNNCLGNSKEIRKYSDINEQLQETVYYCTKLTQEQPNNIEAFLVLGRSKYWLQDYNGAILDLDKVIIASSDNEQAYLFRGESKFYLQNYLNSIVDFSSVIKLSPKNSAAFLFRGKAKYYMHDYIGAVQDFNQLIELDPKSEEGYLQRGNAKFMLQDYLGAIQDDNYALELYPQYYQAYLERGTAKSFLKDNQGALQDFDIAINIMALELEQSKIPTNSPDSWAKIQKYYQKNLNDNLAKGYYLRGNLKLLLLDEKNSGCLDLSISGEKGYINAYDLIQKYCH